MTFIRLLHIKQGVAIQDVPVAISTPVEREGSWFCNYEIGWPEGTRSDEIGGADALHAIYLCMQAVALTLYASPYHKSGSLYWRQPGDGYGFPMPKSARGDLVGQDRELQL